MDTRYCRKCQRVLPVSEFYKSTRGGCKACVQAYHREWWKARQTPKQPLPEGLKRCNGCGEVKPLVEFYRDKSTKDGRHAHCKKCSDRAKRLQEERRKSQQPTKDVIPEGFKRCSKCREILPVSDFAKLRGATPRPRCRNCERDDRKQNYEQIKAREIIYQGRPEVRERRNVRKQEKRHNDLEHRAKEKAYRLEYRKRDYVLEKNRERNANYRNRPENASKARQNTIKWRRENIVQARLHGQIKYARRAGAEGSHTEEQWQELIALCGHKCLMCGVTWNLTRDHIIPLKYEGSNFIDNIQPLCHHCNTVKREVLIIDYRPPQAREWAAKEVENDL